ncbi:hypothetical protein JCM6882_000926 [Rhodosporidiobolus microsporus]
MPRLLAFLSSLKRRARQPFKAAAAKVKVRRAKTKTDKDPASFSPDFNVHLPREILEQIFYEFAAPPRRKSGALDPCTIVSTLSRDWRSFGQ